MPKRLGENTAEADFFKEELPVTKEKTAKKADLKDVSEEKKILPIPEHLKAYFEAGMKEVLSFIQSQLREYLDLAKNKKTKMGKLDEVYFKDSDPVMSELKIMVENFSPVLKAFILEKFKGQGDDRAMMLVEAGTVAAQNHLQKFLDNPKALEVIRPLVMTDKRAFTEVKNEAFSLEKRAKASEMEIKAAEARARIARISEGQREVASEAQFDSGWETKLAEAKSFGDIIKVLKKKDQILDIDKQWHKTADIVKLLEVLDSNKDIRSTTNLLGFLPDVGILRENVIKLLQKRDNVIDTNDVKQEMVWDRKVLKDIIDGNLLLGDWQQWGKDEFTVDKRGRVRVREANSGAVGVYLSRKELDELKAQLYEKDAFHVEAAQMDRKVSKKEAARLDDINEVFQQNRGKNLTYEQAEKIAKTEYGPVIDKELKAETDAVKKERELDEAVSCNPEQYAKLMKRLTKDLPKVKSQADFIKLIRSLGSVPVSENAKWPADGIEKVLSFLVLPVEKGVDREALLDLAPEVLRSKLTELIQQADAERQRAKDAIEEQKRKVELAEVTCQPGEYVKLMKRLTKELPKVQAQNQLFDLIRSLGYVPYSKETKCPAEKLIMVLRAFDAPPEKRLDKDVLMEIVPEVLHSKLAELQKKSESVSRVPLQAANEPLREFDLEHDEPVAKKNLQQEAQTKLQRESTRINLELSGQKEKIFDLMDLSGAARDQASAIVGLSGWDAYFKSEAYSVVDIYLDDGEKSAVKKAIKAYKNLEKEYAKVTAKFDGESAAVEAPEPAAPDLLDKIDADYAVQKIEEKYQINVVEPSPREQDAIDRLQTNAEFKALYDAYIRDSKAKLASAKDDAVIKPPTPAPAPAPRKGFFSRWFGSK